MDLNLKGRVALILDGGPCRSGLESAIVDARGRRPVLLRPGTLAPEVLARAARAPLIAQYHGNMRERSSREKQITMRVFAFESYACRRLIRPRGLIAGCSGENIETVILRRNHNRGSQFAPLDRIHGRRQKARDFAR